MIKSIPRQRWIDNLNGVDTQSGLLFKSTYCKYNKISRIHFRTLTYDQFKILEVKKILLRHKVND